MTGADSKQFSSLQKSLSKILYEGTWVISSPCFNLRVIGGIKKFYVFKSLVYEICTKEHECFETAGSIQAWSEAKQFQSLQKTLWWVLYEVTLVFWSSWFYLSVIGGKSTFIPSECSEMNSVRRNMGVLKLLVQCQRDLRHQNVFSSNRSFMNSVRKNMSVLKLLVQWPRDLRQNNFNLYRSFCDEFFTK